MELEAGCDGIWQEDLPFLATYQDPISRKQEGKRSRRNCLGREGKKGRGREGRKKEGRKWARISVLNKSLDSQFNTLIVQRKTQPKAKEGTSRVRTACRPHPGLPGWCFPPNRTELRLALPLGLH
jgi:hypothetical protein